MVYRDPFSIDSLAAELIKEHAKLEEAKKDFERLKCDLLKLLIADNVSAVKVAKGTVTVCTRNTKDYGHGVKIMEANLKAEKTRLEHLMEFTISKETKFIRID